MLQAFTCLILPMCIDVCTARAALLIAHFSGCRFDATQMRKKAAETTRWKDVPHLDEPFINQNLKHMVALQIIGPPGQPAPCAKAPEQ